MIMEEMRFFLSIDDKTIRIKKDIFILTAIDDSIFLKGGD